MGLKIQKIRVITPKIRVALSIKPTQRSKRICPIACPFLSLPALAFARYNLLVSNYRSVVAQTLHYLSRPHVGLPHSPIRSAAAWRGLELRKSETWQWALTYEQNGELRTLLNKLKQEGRELRSLTPADCPLPLLTDAIQAWRHEIIHGRGFVLVSGLSVDQLTTEECETIFWCLGLHLGLPGAQNSAGDLLTQVRDEGNKSEDTGRLYKTSAAIAYHCDAADIVGLLCVQNSQQGGLSRIASSVTVFNEFLKSYPELADKLFEPLLMDARGENGLDYVTIEPLRFDGKNLRTFYHSDYFRSVKRFPKVKSEVEKYEDILNKYEAIALDPDIYLEMTLKPGDMQFISNHTIIHGRTAYEDTSVDQKRHLLRLWLSSAEKESLRLRLLRFKARLKLLKSLFIAKFL